MDTKIVKISRYRPQKKKIGQAAEIIRRAGLVAFPTETVYGLGANALDRRAVAKIFKAKKRPVDDPLIVHIADLKDLKRLAKDFPCRVRMLAEKFWPGPLTVILKKNPLVPREVTAGLDSVAIRMPGHPIALELIRAAGVSIAAPSANLFGQTSPISAAHVANDLCGRIDMIIDGGKTRVGVESTVLDMTGKSPVILRPGGIPLEEIRKVLPEARLFPSEKKPAKIERMKSPGMHYRHYAPRAEMVLIEGDSDKVADKMAELAEKYLSEGRKVGILASKETAKLCPSAARRTVLGKRGNFSTIARNLFKMIRELDRKGIDIILAEGFPEKGLGAAVMNRLRRAAGKRISAR